MITQKKFAELCAAVVRQRDFAIELRKRSYDVHGFCLSYELSCIIVDTFNSVLDMLREAEN